MQWNPDHIAHPENWWVKDLRWLGHPDSAEFEALFGDRPWIIEQKDPAPAWKDEQSGVPGLITADLIWDRRDREYDDMPRQAYLGQPFCRPPKYDRRGDLQRIEAGTPVTIHGQRWYRTSRPEDVTMYVWSLEDGTRLSAFPTRRGELMVLLYSLVGAVVVPSSSPLATVQAGERLVEQAFALADAAWIEQFVAAD